MSFKIEAISNYGRTILERRKDWVYYTSSEKVLCFDNNPGILFISTNPTWYGVWARKHNDKNFKFE
jgi:hypothetical protein